MLSDDSILINTQQELVDLNLGVKAIIQDILALKGSSEYLQEYNHEGRLKISGIKKCIEILHKIAKQNGDTTLLNETESHRNELTSTLRDFRKANIIALEEIERYEKNKLLSYGDDDKDNARNVRKRTGDKTGLVKKSSGITDQLLSISRNLAQTTERSAATLETLAMSSTNVSGTREELENTAGTIAQSGKLLKKYGRREFTDKILMFFAFAFFLACVVYIVQKRIF